MGYSIKAVDNSGNQVSYFHYPASTTKGELLLYRAFSVKPTENETVKHFSKGNLLQAKSFLNTISDTEGELSFVEDCIIGALTNDNKITITFN